MSSTETATTPSHGGNISSLVRKGCAQLFFVYGGGGGMMGMSPTRFIQESGLGNRNVTFIRDPDQSYYENGVSADIPSLEALIDWHEDFIRRQSHVRELYCVGNSAGGYAAMLFGYLLGVKKVWAFAPAGLKGLPVLQELLAEGNGETEYIVMYGRSIPLDRNFAESFAGCPGVNLVPCEGEKDDHLVIRRLLELGELADLFPAHRAVG